jgi:hypothetical protein
MISIVLIEDGSGQSRTDIRSTRSTSCPPTALDRRLETTGAPSRQIIILQIGPSADSLKNRVCFLLSAGEG